MNVTGVNWKLMLISETVFYRKRYYSIQHVNVYCYIANYVYFTNDSEIVSKVPMTWVDQTTKQLTLRLEIEDLKEIAVFTSCSYC